jgi:hypothetical protein
MSRQEEKIILPEPLKVKPSIAKYLDKLEDDGKTIWAFEGSDVIENIFYLHLMNKYKSKCVPKGTKRPIGLDIPLKVKYTKAEEIELNEQFNEIGKIITDCVKRGEEMILLPLTYIRGMGGHFNLLVYKVNNNEVEHFEPHGGEYTGNERLQDSSKKVMEYFVNILNIHLKRNGLHIAKYVEASEVCPYIRGLQDIEGLSKLKTLKIEPGGYCAAWGLFFAELNLKNHHLTSSEILDNIYNYLTTKESGPNYLRSVIRGYAGYIYQNVDRYLEIFFKPRIRLIDLVGRKNRMDNILKILKLKDVMKVLIDLEMKIVSDQNFDYKKELKSVMKEYKKETLGKTKDEQREMRKKNIILRTLYYKKRILQNYEEYKRDGHISEPVFDSPEDIREEDIKDLTITEKGHLHELVAKEKQKRQEELEKNPLYIEQQKLREQMKERRKGLKTAKKTSSQGKTKKLRPTAKDIKLMEEIIKREKLDMKTKEGQEKLLKILQDMANE